MATVNEFLTQAEQLAGDKQYPEAATAYISAARLCEDKADSASMYNKAGVCFFRADMREEELNCYTLAIDLISPDKKTRFTHDSAAYYSNRAETYCHLGKTELAISDYEESVNIWNYLHNPFATKGNILHAQTLMSLADLQFKSGYADIGKLETLIDHAISLVVEVYAANPESNGIFLSQLWNFLGVLHFANGNFSGEVSACTQAIELRDKNHLERDSNFLYNCYNNRAQAYENLESYDKAASDYECSAGHLITSDSYLPTDATYENILLSAGIMHDCGEKYNKAFECYEKAINHIISIENWRDLANCRGIAALLYYRRANSFIKVKHANYSKAVRDYNLSYELMAENNDINSLIIILKARAAVYEFLDEQESASLDIEEIKQLTQQLENSKPNSP